MQRYKRFIFLFLVALVVMAAGTIQLTEKAYAIEACWTACNHCLVDPELPCIPLYNRSQACYSNGNTTCAAYCGDLQECD